VVLTNTVKTTPKISIITCIVVELWAGSTFILLKINGSKAPKQILVKTMIASAHVTATVSAIGVLNTVARMNPATDKIKLRAHAILNSRFRNCLCVLSLSVPNAIPRMTVEIWLVCFVLMIRTMAIHIDIYLSRSTINNTQYAINNTQYVHNNSFNSLTSHSSLIPSITPSTDQHGQKVYNDRMSLQQHFIPRQNKSTHTLQSQQPYQPIRTILQRVLK